MPERAMPKNAMPGDFWLPASWSAPPWVRAGCTTRRGGYSGAPYTGLNLGTGHGDRPGRVRANRARLRALLGLPGRPCWLRQEHGRRLVEARPGRVPPRADGSFTNSPGTVCAVLAADCVPLLLCDRAGTQVAAVHVGWRGLLRGMPEAALRALRTAPSGLLAWIGPCIGVDCFEVGEETAAACRRLSAAGGKALRRDRGRTHLDLPLWTRLRLYELGVRAVYGADCCTACHPERYYSYRRDGVRTGRMAGLVWLSPMKTDPVRVHLPAAP